MRITKEQAISNIKSFEANKAYTRLVFTNNVIDDIYKHIYSASLQGQKSVEYLLITPKTKPLTMDDIDFIITEFKRGGDWDITHGELTTTRGGGSHIIFEIKIMD